MIPTLQRNWYDLAIDLVDAENLDVDRARILKRLNRFYFKQEPPEKASVHTFAQVGNPICSLFPIPITC